MIKACIAKEQKCSDKETLAQTYSTEECMQKSKIEEPHTKQDRRMCTKEKAYSNNEMQ